MYIGDRVKRICTYILERIEVLVAHMAIDCGELRFPFDQ